MSRNCVRSGGSTFVHLELGAVPLERHSDGKNCHAYRNNATATARTTACTGATPRQRRQRQHVRLQRTRVRLQRKLVRPQLQRAPPRRTCRPPQRTCVPPRRNAYRRDETRTAATKRRTAVRIFVPPECARRRPRWAGAHIERTAFCSTTQPHGRNAQPYSCKAHADWWFPPRAAASHKLIAMSRRKTATSHTNTATRTCPPALRQIDGHVAHAHRRLDKSTDTSRTLTRLFPLDRFTRSGDRRC